MGEINKRVAIIGAGPAGGIALDTFLKAGFTNVTVFERQSTSGGTWNLDEQLNPAHKPDDLPDLPGIERLGENPNPPVKLPQGIESATATKPLVLPIENFGPRYTEGNLYPQVETNVWSELMAFTKYPFPDIHPPQTKERFGVDDAYRSHEVIREYVRQFFKGREDHVQFNTTVERVSQVNGPGSVWELVLRKRRDNEHEEWWVEQFDFVYAASGKFNVPRLPSIPGLKETYDTVPKGTILHTKVFRDPTRFTGKKLLLIAASWSNADVAHLAKNAGVELPVHVAARNILEVAIPGFAQPWIETHANVASLAVAKDGKRIDVKFADGTSLENVDNIVIGTGYRLSFPYLEEYFSQYGGICDELGSRSNNLYWTTWFNRDPSLAVSSLVTDTITWRVLEAQANASAALWQQPRSTWPTYEEAVEWEKARTELNLHDFHTWYPHYNELLIGLNKVGQLDTSESLPPYLDMFRHSIGMKQYYWNRLSKESVEEHPEWRGRLERTTEFFEKVKS